jgi:phosphomannomutase
LSGADFVARKFFGTDGVRGRANSHPMTADMALRLGAAAGRFFRRDDTAPHRVVIGKDTRLSGYMLENALTAGFTSTGMNVLLLGPVPTPAVGLLTPSMRADVGVMISASHNPAEDNGIKFFGPGRLQAVGRGGGGDRGPARGGRAAGARGTSGGRSGSMTDASAMSSGSRAPFRAA